MTDIVEAWNGPGRRDGTLTPIEPWHNGFHPSPRSSAFEHWYFDAHLDSGHVVIGFFIKRRPEDPPFARPWVEMMVYSPDGTRRQVARRYPRSAATFAVGGCDVRIGANTARAEPTGDGPAVHHFHMAEDDLVFDLTFTNETPGWLPGRGETRFGPEDRFGWVVPAPRARVEGTVEIDGARREVTGRGYHDHNWGSGDMKRIIDRWHWGRLYTEDHTLLFATVVTQPRLGAHAIAPLMLADHDRITLSTGETTLTEGPPVFDPVAGRTRPEWIELRIPGEVELRLEVTRVIHAHDLLDDVPLVRSRPLRALAHRLIGHPGYFRFESAFTLTVHGPGGPLTRTGTTLHELVALT
ncbi:lipocalin-like domain-containing protein [Nocardia thailandica]|uniref:lipocalin-like domain-containing protein n=1 Tax=Nocardia thailandica TaxID=257275 RepID=UPI0002F48C66|nr:lipocalin-like domain-containing protein [Nocardia thailandica]